eukprot:GHVO01039326.1.p2 GENE.GHVO01039326.1~~GHVO01039326.1.p2  ORF type:complete len:120 (+),score=7.18 GHVO01039326.1:144-503(+)
MYNRSAGANIWSALSSIAIPSFDVMFSGYKSGKAVMDTKLSSTEMKEPITLGEAMWNSVCMQFDMCTVEKEGIENVGKEDIFNALERGGRELTEHVSRKGRMLYPYGLCGFMCSYIFTR